MSTRSFRFAVFLALYNLGFVALDAAAGSVNALTYCDLAAAAILTGIIFVESRSTNRGA